MLKVAPYNQALAFEQNLDDQDFRLTLFFHR